MNVFSRCFGFFIMLILSSILGLLQGFTICYLFSSNTIYLMAAFFSGLVLGGSVVSVYYYFKKIEPYTLNGIKPEPIFSTHNSNDESAVIRELENTKFSRKPTLFGFSKTLIDLKEETEPLVDVINGGNTIHIVAELPGVEIDNIKLICSENILTISVDTARRKYYTEVKLPAIIDPKTCRTRYSNGVLDVNLTKFGLSS
jgi:HSP20 family molecular chaperone IbpA